MSSSQIDWVSLAEEVIDEALDDAVEIFADLVEVAGPRPFGFHEGDRLAVLYAFVDRKADLTNYAHLVRRAQFAQQTGQTESQAETWIGKEDKRLARSIRRIGNWDGSREDKERAFLEGCRTVQLQWHYRQAQQASRDVQAARRIMDLPKAEILPRPTLIDPVEALGLELAPEQFAAMTGMVGAALEGGPGPALVGEQAPPLWPIATYGPNRERPYSDYPAEPGIVPQ